MGLLPIAAAGISIDDLMKGAADSMERFSDVYKRQVVGRFDRLRKLNARFSVQKRAAVSCVELSV